MSTIAILTGGDTAEKVISLQSSAVVLAHLPVERFRCFEIDIEGTNWCERTTRTPIDKNDFSLTLNGEHIHFDAAFAALHGSPLEDGKLQGYLELLGVPYTCCDGFVSALTMNKHRTKQFLTPLGVPMARSALLHQGQQVDHAALLDMGLPLFVKPNTQGSSFGVTKVKSAETLQPAIEEAWRFDPEVVVESYLPGREFSNGAFRHKGKVVVLPVTEIIPDGEFFDYAAKYEGKSKEVTPAPLTPEQTDSCQARSRFLYNALGCQGVVRFDYILAGETFYFLEVNTIPGLSSASLVPQQARADGWTLDAFFAALLDEVLEPGA
ncbi:MAG: D-alanine--D-alanine ligase family protein [Saprospiraceae bacterium]